jgi:hypothetical protein
MAGIVPKWGTSNPTLPQSTTIHFLNDEAPGQEAISLAVRLPNENTAFTLLGQYRVIDGPTTLSAVTPKNRNAPQLLVVALTDGFPLVAEMFVHNTTQGSRATVYLDGGTMTQPFPALVLGSVTVPGSEDDSWAMGQTVVVERPLDVNVLDITVEGAGVIVFQALRLVDPSGSPGNTHARIVNAASSASGGSFIADCAVETALFVSCGLTGIVWWVNTVQIPTNPEVFLSGQNGGDQVVLGGAYTEFFSSFSGGASFLGGGLILDGDVILGQTCFVTGPATYGFVYIDESGANFPHQLQVGPVIMGDPLFFGSAATWGSADVQLSLGCKAYMSLGGLWVNTWLSSGHQLIDNGGGHASAFNTTTGIWTGNVVISAANIDANVGLCNPVTGTAWAFQSG